MRGVKFPEKKNDLRNLGMTPNSFSIFYTELTGLPSMFCLIHEALILAESETSFPTESKSVKGQI